MLKLHYIVLMFFVALAANAASNEVTFQGTPAIQVSFDREYSVMSVGPKSGPAMKALRLFMLIPQDDQSSAVFAIGKIPHKKTEKVIAEMNMGAKVTKVTGEIAGKKVEWWRYQDANHLYSTCYTTLEDKEGKETELAFDLTANTPERLTALEKAFSGLKFL